MKTENLKITDLKPYERNAKQHPRRQIDQIKESIRRFGMNDPIGVWGKDNLIVEGHGRYIACKEMGIEEVPCIRLDHLSDAERKEYTLIHNKTTMNSDFDLDFLKTELDDIGEEDPDIDMGFFDFSMEDEIDEANLTEDEAPEVQEGEAIAKKGDVWQLGDHRVMCGDSTSADDVAKLMGGKTADLVFTDPPYGMKKESDGVENDNLNYDDLLEFNKEWIPLAFDCLKDTGCFYCWGIDEPLMDIYSAIIRPMQKENKAVFRNYITWAKHSALGVNSSGMLSYPRETEKCLFVMKGQDWNNNNQEFFNTKFERILDYMRGEADKLGIGPKDIARITGVQMYSHWFTRSQFTIIPERHYRKLQETYPGSFTLDYSEIRGLLGTSNDPNASLKPYFDNKAERDAGDIGLTDVWRFPTTSNEEREDTGGHATPKPLELCRRGIKASSKQGDIVLDMFGGSGSTLIACEQMRRSCYVMEITPAYVDVIVKRWEKHTGKKAVRIDG